MTMIILNYRITFTTPAFLGDAEQNGRWRTPPIKALLRQWWRVAYAADHGFTVNVKEMRREEGLLFGNAWLKDDFRKSLVRIRLDKWSAGTLRNWQSLAPVTHPEVSKAVGSDLYLGFGPLVFKGGTALKANAAIQAGEAATLSIAWPTERCDPEIHKILDENNAKQRIENAIWLMDRYGTLGGRSRNGWGSFSLLPLPPGESRGEGTALTATKAFQGWSDCLTVDWPHAIGRDEHGALIWHTPPANDWKTAMKRLAEIKIELRTQKPQFELPLNPAAGDKPTKSGISHGRPQNRHWLSYPITKHAVANWGNTRLPNVLRFKVRQASDGKLVGVIFHVPHLPPAGFNPSRPTIERVWKSVHAFLDDPKQQLQRITE